MHIFSLCFQDLKPHSNTILGSLKIVLYGNCYCSEENVIWLEQWLKHSDEQNEFRFVLAFLPVSSWLPTTYTHKHNFSHQIKANLTWKQMWILFVCAYCINYSILNTEPENKPQNVQKSQFNKLTTTWYNSSLATWKLVIYPYWQVCNTQTSIIHV